MFYFILIPKTVTNGINYFRKNVIRLPKKLICYNLTEEITLA
jgi:hypothetical protein